MRPPIKDKKVFAAVQILLAEGQTVTVSRLRSVLARAYPSYDYIGRPNPVQRHLSNYYQQNGEKNEQ
jgi:hypothetical protein